MEKLIGKTIISIGIANDYERICFVTDEGQIDYITEADCCSETWFHELMNVDALIGGKVAGVTELDLPAPPDALRQDSDILYGYRIDTDKGSANLVFRNSSNGYYGGSIAEIKSDERSFRPVTEDFSGIG